jgi:hypothetical protein
LPGYTHSRILVAIETDATRYHGEHPSRPQLLDRPAAEQMLAHLSTDLASHFPELKSCSLCMAGALFDQTQLLRPEYPVFRKLEELATARCAGGPMQPGLLSFGAESGRMPEPELQPESQIPLGLLQTLPLVFSGPPDLVDQLSETMEHRFLEFGQLSAHSARALEANFGVAVNHARFMTLTDLNAMLNLQLEHFGFLPLWQLIDTALNTPQEPLEVEGRGGQSFHWDGQRVTATFETFDHWAAAGKGKDHASDAQMLARGYTDWTREYRQYLTTLSAHAIPFVQVLPGLEEILETSFVVEHTGLKAPRDSAWITEHSSGELGTVAVTVAVEGEQFNYYPLLPPGLNDLHAAIREQVGSDAAVSFPGSILYDPRTRRLCPDTLPAGESP